MSTLTELEWIEAESKAIYAAPEPRTPEEHRDWWYRLANWWHRRNLSYGDGTGMVKECLARAHRIQDTIDSIGAYI